MTPEQLNIFVGTMIQDCNKFLLSGKKIISSTFLDTSGNRCPIAVLLQNKWSSHNLIMSEELTKKFGFEITPRDVASFNHGLDGSPDQYWDEPGAFAMGRMVAALFSLK